MTAVLDLAALRRFPDVEAANLQAVDATDRLLLDIAADYPDHLGRGLVVIGDHYGALSLGAADRFGLNDVRVHQDSIVSERALQANAVRFGLAGRTRSLALSDELVAGAGLVLVQLPKSLTAVAELAEVIARSADPDVVVLLGGRVKHLSLGMNDVLGRYFADLTAGLARQKSRVLTARGPLPVGEPGFPLAAHLDELDLEIRAHGAAFAGTRLDLGTRRLAEVLDGARPGAQSAIDLGCGTGILAALLLRARPELKVLATDSSAAAIESTAATLAANGLAGPAGPGGPGGPGGSDPARVTLLRDDALSSVADASADLIVCNPPFHIEGAVHIGPAVKMFRAAGRVLAPGGELWTVFNSHLEYRAILTDAVGPTSIVSRDPKFSVARSRRLDTRRR
ncbi:methyltransferase [Jatrophihabitans telluris]|uniref:Methyltransferase n=1 Tax=Jatrophihabitans telluris TaxID=2038343 RepID=A0ABY4QY36_9ACTN|nr:methyltransferase [Jatrophihabitans telluris]UQX88601.1 methyltransferase [Jatrophihabitans telluris]